MVVKMSDTMRGVDGVDRSRMRALDDTR